VITLITGALGTGKTALAVKLLMESGHYPGSVFVYGVRGWKGAGRYYDLQSQEFAAENQALLEKTGRVSHSCYLVDEAKKVWPTRVAGRPEPAFINGHLAESRSVSQDWILTAQAPGQVDVALRRLVGRHIHLEKVALGIKKSESGACRDDLKFGDSESEKYSFPVASLQMYESDEGVTKLQKKGVAVPKKFIWLGLFLVSMIVMVWYFASKSNMVKSLTGAENEQVVGSSMLGAMTGEVPKAVSVTDAPSPFYFDPKVNSYPELAKAPRYPVSCVASKVVCKCWDQAGQYLELLGDQRCREIVSGKNKLAVLYPVPEVKKENDRQQKSEKTENEKIAELLMSWGYEPKTVRALTRDEGAKNGF